MMRYATWAPVALRLLRLAPILSTMSDGARRKSHPACAIEKALMPTYAYFNVGDVIGDDYSFPRSRVGMHTELKPSPEIVTKSSSRTCRVWLL
ncbi:hypothetical protein BZG80_00695 [Salinivibrio sp. MA440]|nr:hypothetical protein BZG80_00695 [Salinivibrio sp. MA440]